MSGKCLGGCKEFSEKFEVDFNCCGSCHYDHEEHDCSLCIHQAEDVYYEVCCNATEALWIVVKYLQTMSPHIRVRQ